MTLGELISTTKDEQIVNIDLMLSKEDVAEGISLTVWRLKHLLETPIQYWQGSKDTAACVQIVINDLDLFEKGDCK